MEGHVDGYVNLVQQQDADHHFRTDLMAELEAEYPDFPELWQRILVRINP